MEKRNERIELQTVNGKNRPVMLRQHYDLLVDFILDSIQRLEPISLTELMEAANNKFSDLFSGEVALPLLNAKRDLEARGLILINYEKNRNQLISLKRESKKTSLAGNYIASRKLIENAEEYAAKQKSWIVNY
jgi:hypothetical protein